MIPQTVRRLFAAVAALSLGLTGPLPAYALRAGLEGTTQSEVARTIGAPVAAPNRAAAGMEEGVDPATAIEQLQMLVQKTRATIVLRDFPDSLRQLLITQLQQRGLRYELSTSSLFVHVRLASPEIQQFATCLQTVLTEITKVQWEMGQPTIASPIHWTLRYRSSVALPPHYPGNRTPAFLRDRLRLFNTTIQRGALFGRAFKTIFGPGSARLFVYSVSGGSAPRSLLGGASEFGDRPATGGGGQAKDDRPKVHPPRMKMTPAQLRDLLGMPKRGEPDAAARALLDRAPMLLGYVAMACAQQPSAPAADWDAETSIFLAAPKPSGPLTIDHVEAAMRTFQGDAQLTPAERGFVARALVFTGLSAAGMEEGKAGRVASRLQKAQAARVAAIELVQRWLAKVPIEARQAIVVSERFLSGREDLRGYVKLLQEVPALEGFVVILPDPAGSFEGNRNPFLMSLEPILRAEMPVVLYARTSDPDAKALQQWFRSYRNPARCEFVGDSARSAEIAQLLRDLLVTLGVPTSGLEETTHEMQTAVELGQAA